MTENPLLTLPAAALALLAGDARQRLVRYLSRWGHSQALLAYLNQWLVSQPQSVTLRENRVRALLDLKRAEEALAMLDALDAERAPSQSRRQARLHALTAAGRYNEAHALLDELEGSYTRSVYGLLQRGDIHRGAGAFEAAAACYREAGEADPESPAAARRLAALALQMGDAETARGQIDALMLRPAFLPSNEDLELLLEVARRRDDHAAAYALTAQLADREREERERIEAELGLRLAKAADPADSLPVPPPPAERPLPAEAYTALRNLFGFNDFRPNQSRVIADVLAGRSALAVMPTGAGKSLTYQLPAMLLPQATVVVSPLIALMKDQLDGLPDTVRERATMINSTLSGAELRERLAGVAAGRYKLVYIAPERLRQRPFLHALRRCGVSLFVVDEAHCVSLWGLSFRPDYLFIGRAISELGGPPILALTATASHETQAEIRAHLGEVNLVSASVFRPNLYFEVVRAGNREEKDAALIEICRSIEGTVIVYARARQSCEELADMLRRNGVSADHYHAQVADRATTQERFMRGQVRVLVATVAFGMGIDKADIRAIVHYNLPQSVEAYYQEAGRAGRDGRPARCVLLYSASDKARLSTWLNESAITRDQLRALYRELRRPVTGRYGVVDLERIERTLQPQDETFMRVGLSMLEQVHLLRRHFDLPASATLMLRDGLADDPALRSLVHVAGLSQGITSDVELIRLAQELGSEPSALEAQLLEWHDAGLLRYRPGPREVLIELLPPPEDVGARIDSLLADYQRRQDERIEAIGAYARAAQCRHRSLSAHFGQRLERCQSACDICAGSRRLPITIVSNGRRGAPAAPTARDSSDPRSDAQRALDALHHLPFPMGRSGLARVLKGAASSAVEQDRCPEYAALRHMSIKAVEDLIEELIADGFIARDERDEFRRLSLTSLGRRARRDPSQL